MVFVSGTKVSCVCVCEHTLEVVKTAVKQNGRALSFAQRESVVYWYSI